MEELGGRDGTGADPLHLLENAHGEQNVLAPQGTGRDEDRVGLLGELLRDLLGLRLELDANVDEILEEILGLGHVVVIAVEIAAKIQQTQGEGLEQQVGEVAAAGGDGSRDHRGRELAERCVLAGEGDDADALGGNVLDRLDDLLGVAGSGGGDHDGVLLEAVVAHHVELGGVDQVNLDLGVLLHEVADHVELVIGAADAQQEDVLIPLLVNLVGDRLGLGAGRHGGVAVLQVLVDIEVKKLDLLEFRHGVTPLVSRTLHDVLHYNVM